jgi:hypothetical protein
MPIPPAMDDARGARILARVAPVLDADDWFWLMERIEPAWRRRQRRLGDRDAAICALATQMAGASGRALAQNIARDLLRYATSGWRFERDEPPPADPARALMHRILTANGKTPSLATIRRALAGIGAGAKSAPAMSRRPCEPGAHEAPDSDQAPRIGRG